MKPSHFDWESVQEAASKCRDLVMHTSDKSTAHIREIFQSLCSFGAPLVQPDGHYDVVWDITNPVIRDSFMQAINIAEGIKNFVCVRIVLKVVADQGHENTPAVLALIDKLSQREVVISTTGGYENPNDFSVTYVKNPGQISETRQFQLHDPTQFLVTPNVASEVQDFLKTALTY